MAHSAKSLFLAFSLLLVLTRPVTVAEAEGRNECSAGEERLTLVTYNTGLIASVPGFRQRREAVPAAVKRVADDVDADIMCFQELWHESDLEAVIRSLESDFPYHYSAIHSKTGLLRDDRINQLSAAETAPCGEEILGLFGCIQQNCSDAEDQITCCLLLCGKMLLPLSPTCRACIVLTATDMRTVLAQCADWSERSNRFNLPGLFVASRRPLSAVYTSFASAGSRPLIERGYITAKVKGAPVVVCTHFTVDITAELGLFYIEAGLPYSSYAQQQRAEITVLDTEFTGSVHVLLGDLNTGPARRGSGEKNLTGEIAANYALLESLGYQNPFLDTDGRCTHCFSTNTAIQTEASSRGTVGCDKAIDHILTSKQLDSVNGSAQRLFDKASGEGLSDHYGVKLDVCVPDSNVLPYVDVTGCRRDVIYYPVWAASFRTFQ